VSAGVTVSPPRLSSKNRTRSGRSVTKKLSIFSLIFCLAISGGASNAGNRIAFIIANQDYKNTPLSSPIADAELIKNALQSAEFTTVMANNLDSEALKASVGNFLDFVNRYKQSVTREFGRPPAIDALLFYYAGHAIQFDGENYVIPIDVGTDEKDIKRKIVPFNSILSEFKRMGADALIIFIDACRNNPFKRDGSAPNGLAEINAALNTFIGFSAAPGHVAVDSIGKNSPFAKALASGLRKENLTIEKMFKGVRDQVFKDTNQFQVPWDSSSLVREFEFVPTGAFGEHELAPSAMDTQLKLWEKVSRENTRSGYSLYLKLFPFGIHSDEARRRLRQ
jgi:uncharacterized caspase-like protein